jgi:thiamine pyrophosphate-dependent acetolactate synthase large subunit-like protein
MLGMGDLLTQIERKTPVVQVILNNGKFDFVHIEQQEAGIVPFTLSFARQALNGRLDSVIETIERNIGIV